MSLNPISTLNSIVEVSSSQDVIMILDSTNTETKQIPITEFNIAIQSSNLPLSGSFSGSFEGDGSGITGATGNAWDGQHSGDVSVTGSFTVSGPNSLVDFSNVENGVSGSFSGSYTGSFKGDGSGLYNITAETASYILSTGVDGPYGMDSILTSSHAVSSSFSLSSSYAVSSSTSLSSSYTLTADYVENPGSDSIFTSTGSFYATTNDLQITGSLEISGSFSSDTFNIGSNQGNTTVEGILNTKGKYKPAVRRVTLANTNDTYLITDNILYVDVTSDALGNNNTISIPSIKGQEITLLVKNPNHYPLRIQPATNGGNQYINDLSIIALELNNYKIDNINGFGTSQYPTYIKYHLICYESIFNVRFLMNVNFGKIYSR